MLATRMRRASGGLLFPYIAMIDDFERGNLTPYSGGTSGFSISSDVSHRGSYSCRAVETSNSNIYYMYASSGLDNYCENGYKCGVFIYLHDDFDLTGADVGLVIGASDTSNLFRLEISPRNEYLSIKRRRFASDTTLNTESISRSKFEKEVWTKAEVTWNTDGDIVLAYYDKSNNLLQSVSATDSNFKTNKGTGFLSNASGGSNKRRAYYDDFHVIEYVG